MSWLIENYIINKENMKSEYDIDSEPYLDILIIESVMSKMQKRGLLSAKEIDVLIDRSYGFTFDEISRKLNMTRITVSAIFSSACEKIAYILGGYFTDEGFLEYLVNKYNLNQETTDKIYNFIKSNNRHKMKRTDFLFVGENNEA